MTTPAARWAILDGRRVPQDGAAVHVSDLGLRRGYAVFEAFRVKEGVPLFLEEHLARLARSADAVGLPLPRGIDGARPERSTSSTTTAYTRPNAPARPSPSSRTTPSSRAATGCWPASA